MRRLEPNPETLDKLKPYPETLDRLKALQAEFKRLGRRAPGREQSDLRWEFGKIMHEQHVTARAVADLGVCEGEAYLRRGFYREHPHWMIPNLDSEAERIYQAWLRSGAYLGPYRNLGVHVFTVEMNI